MKNSIQVILGLLIIVTVSSASELFYVRPIQRTGVYENSVRERNERSLEQVDESDRLLVRKSQGRYYFIEHQGIEGWIEQSKVARTEGRTYTFNKVIIDGYDNTVTALHIADQQAELTRPVNIERSFEKALKTGTDKESILLHRQ
ncbi:hypothetical protein [Chitinivibrio alkaliphilus]|uniref:Uncharacterized protein n=1 Tax=Chitinivibrio alkaliphilus ACht1 TaxID=1313304 RepID=U7D6E0_9BACT|nr:hypothetical protein [Chitinivibrio alkaliphilus]ERP31141.1 hypothetical protein CALK_1939 [Chitinivibrio alkaliphilus ACht1]